MPPPPVAVVLPRTPVVWKCGDTPHCNSQGYCVSPGDPWVVDDKSLPKESPKCKFVLRVQAGGGEDSKKSVPVPGVAYSIPSVASLGVNLQIGSSWHPVAHCFVAGKIDFNFITVQP